MGSLLFCLAIHISSLQLQSDLCIMYLDDITLGGAVEVLLQDLNVISEIGLSLNSRKSETVCSDHAVYDCVLPSLPNCLYNLLGSPLAMLLVFLLPSVPRLLVSVLWVRDLDY